MSETQGYKKTTNLIDVPEHLRMYMRLAVIQRQAHISSLFTDCGTSDAATRALWAKQYNECQQVLDQLS